MIPRRVTAAALAIATLHAPRAANACATAPPEAAHVAVAEESAIIVWDEATKTEHFIRRASFRSEASDFGFLVPTPTKPELAEADDLAFFRLEYAIRPEVDYHDEIKLEPTLLPILFFKGMSRSKAALELAPVRVLEAKRVGDYDTTVLEADDAGALAEWLRVHGYAKRTALTEWLAPYVEKKWKLTAFKIADDTPNKAMEPRALGTRAVRMSFKTERPFFPYREPRDQRESVPASLSTARSLRIFFVGPGRARATIGDGSTAFPGKTVWSGPLDFTSIERPYGARDGAWLTAIEDDASPRPGVDELWLDRAKEQVPVKPPRVALPHPRRIPIPLDLVAVAGLGIYFIVKRVRRR